MMSSLLKNIGQLLQKTIKLENIFLNLQRMNFQNLIIFGMHDNLKLF